MLFLFALYLPLPGQAAERPLQFGILPYTTPIELARANEPLRRHLEAALGRPVYLRSAVDYAGFAAASAAGNYDLLLTAPHLAPLAAEQAGYRPLLRFKATLSPFFVVRKDGPIHRPGQLKGQRLACPDRLSLACVVGLRELRAQGLLPGRDYTLLDAGSHGNSPRFVHNGKAEAGLAIRSTLHMLPQDLRDALRVVPIDIALPHRMLLVHRDLSQAEAKRLAGGLQDFGDTPAGRQYFEQTGYLGVEAIHPDEWKAVQPYAEEVRKLMKGGS